MKKLRRTSAVVALSLILAVSAIAGTIHSPGVVETPPPPTGGTTTSASTITTTVILTILSLIR